MLTWDDLKERIAITATTVECPVKACGRTVSRRRQQDSSRDTAFSCPDASSVHEPIFITPSTFEYAKESANMLWCGAEDTALWQAIKGVKRESRLASDNSEDALTWNIFRHLERQALLGEFVKITGGLSSGEPNLIYWSWCQRTRRAWQPLVDAAVGFGERVDRRSEPDLIVEDDETILFVENKFGCTNSTRPSNPGDPKMYEAGFDRWFSTVFHPNSTFQRVAVEERLYELMRLWLIGSQVAEIAGKRFVLLNVVLDRTEHDIEERFRRHAPQTDSRRFVRLTWESIRNLVIGPSRQTAEKDLLLAYMAGKTLGYNRAGRLQRAFAGVEP